MQIARFVLERGERVLLAGTSGSGKSTLLSLIAGALSLQIGRVRVMGTDASALPGRQRDRFRGDHIGFVFQSFNLLPYLSVRDNVLLPLQFSRARRERLAGVGAEDESIRLLQALGVGDKSLLKRQVNRLSIGQQQRVAAARALIGRPDVLIADEPTSALDANTRAEFLRLLMSECARFRTSLLFVSHDRTLRNLFDRGLELSEINTARPAETIANQACGCTARSSQPSRNRLGTVLLTASTIAVSVSLLLGVHIVRSAARESFENTLSGTDLVVGARTGSIDLLLLSVFRIGDANANVSWKTYQKIARHPDVAWTISDLAG